MITKVAFIAHPTRDLEAAKTFFGDVLGLSISADYGNCWVELDTPRGETIALDTMSPKFSDQAPVYMALETDDIEAEVAKLKEHGVTVVKDVWTNAEDGGNEICKMAIVLDPDGNSLMLHEIAPARAKS